MADAKEDQGSRDPLLAVTRVVITVALGLCILSLIALPIALAALFARRDQFAAKLAEQGIIDAAPWIAVIMMIAALVAVLGFFFLRHLRRIIDSVSEGDPFAPANADRLRNMAWLVLAVQLIAIPATPLVIWFDAAPFKPNVHHGAGGISIGGLLLASILFVLARVFRTGATMRGELEGTV
ncbi:MAG: DUF2975 domain-containing protein [Pseudomonadota bacterium]|nr:DUF2975 domain-containing protein [Pseudomonadota bacterium]